MQRVFASRRVALRCNRKMSKRDRERETNKFNKALGTRGWHSWHDAHAPFLSPFPLRQRRCVAFPFPPNICGRFYGTVQAWVYDAGLVSHGRIALISGCMGCLSDPVPDIWQVLEMPMIIEWENLNIYKCFHTIYTHICICHMSDKMLARLNAKRESCMLRYQMSDSKSVSWNIL